jgi:hypothetical protein
MRGKIRGGGGNESWSRIWTLPVGEDGGWQACFASRYAD